MGNFHVIAGSGHCGTMWLSQVLNVGTDATWYHECRRALAGAWPDTLRLGPEHERYAGYWRYIRAMLQVGDVGDANSWLPTLLPQVARVVPIDRVIYLTRNPIQQLHSLTSRSYVWRKGQFNEYTEGYLSHLYNVGGYARPWYEWTRWEKLCLLVAANDFMPSWLREHGLSVEVYRLENLTTDADLLRALVPKLSRDEVRRWQRHDVNRKVYGDRTPEAIWQRWSEEQREGFRNAVEVSHAREWEREAV